MDTNLNNAVPFSQNLNLSFLQIVQDEKGSIFQIQTIPFWNNINNFYIPPNPLPPPTLQDPIIKQEHLFSNPPEENFLQKKIQQKNQSSKVKEFKKLGEEGRKLLIKIPPKVQRKAQFFDVSCAPLVTSEDYFLVENSKSLRVKQKRADRKDMQLVNQVDFPENDQNPFIVFKNRRIKKKYRKIMNKYLGSNFQQLHDGSQSWSSVESEEASLNEMKEVKKISMSKSQEEMKETLLKNQA